MAYTQAQIDAMKAALASGYLQIDRADLKIRYRSVEDLQTAIQIAEDELNAGTASARPTTRVARVSKGL
ncbi:MAG: phage head-tail joining protein [Geminicoccaceae bacterium]